MPCVTTASVNSSHETSMDFWPNGLLSFAINFCTTLYIVIFTANLQRIQNLNNYCSVFYSSQKMKRQHFLFPPSMMTYIIKEPSSPIVWEKLVQTCKHFFNENSLIVVDSMVSSYRRNPLKNDVKDQVFIISKKIKGKWLRKF